MRSGVTSRNSKMVFQVSTYLQGQDACTQVQASCDADLQMDLHRTSRSIKDNILNGKSLHPSRECDGVQIDTDNMRQ